MRIAARLSAGERIVEVFPRVPVMRLPVRQIGEREHPFAEVIDRLDGESARACDRLDRLARAEVGARVGGVDARRCVHLAQPMRVANSFLRQRTGVFVEA